MVRKLRRFWGPVLAIGSLMLGASASSLAHKDVAITICIPYYQGSECAKDPGAPSYIYGDDVVVKGRSKPAHGGTVKVQRRKGDEEWKTVAKQDLNDKGRYRYVWHTTEEDADQGTPYRFRTVLPQHDRSPVQKVYVLFSE